MHEENAPAPDAAESSTIVLQGRICLGLGEGKFFTQLPWAKRQFKEKLDIDPYPGTLNLSLETEEDLQRVASLRDLPGIEIVPDSPQFCSGKCFRVRIRPVQSAPSRQTPDAPDSAQPEGGLYGAVVFPEVGEYPMEKLEIISGVNVKQELQVDDGDLLSVTFIS
ncbi:MAG: CTP-dependent riboflavin kinase [Chloroflexi bacterium]|nr:CTP-dependent riboflavin kinase [Chloroflexota bacterium]